MRLAMNGRLVKFNTTIIPRREFSFANYDCINDLALIEFRFNFGGSYRRFNNLPCTGVILFFTITLIPSIHQTRLTFELPQTFTNV
ncbi:MAG: hypothetical protein ACTS42_00135 [Candidatus Hodgkinia cicadicola]